MKKTLLIFAAMAFSLATRAQQVPPYDRTTQNIVLSDRATWSRYFMGTPHGTTPFFPVYIPDTLKAGSLYFQKSDSTIQVYNGASWQLPGQLIFGEGLTKTGHYVGLGGAFTHPAVLNGILSWTTSNNAYLTFSPVLNELADSLINTAVMINPTFSDHSHHGDTDWGLKVQSGQSYFGASIFVNGNISGNNLKINFNPFIPGPNNWNVKDSVDHVFGAFYSKTHGYFFGDGAPGEQASQLFDVNMPVRLTNLTTGTPVNGLAIDASGNVIPFSLGATPGTLGGNNTWTGNNVFDGNVTLGGVGNTVNIPRFVSDGHTPLVIDGSSYLNLSKYLILDSLQTSNAPTTANDVMRLTDMTGYVSTAAAGTRNRQLVVIGSSLTYGISHGGVLTDTATYAYKLAKNLGFDLIARGFPGRTTQQLTVGDSSIYSKYSSIPPYLAGSYLLVEGQVNDENLDTTIYTTSTYTTQLTTAINYWKTTLGWPASHIILTTVSHWTTQPNPPAHGIEPNRHYNYNYAAHAIATSTGVNFYDLFFKALAFDNLHHVLLAADSLHMTDRGHQFAADSLSAYLLALTTTRDLTPYNIMTPGGIYASGPITGKNGVRATGVSTLDLANVNTLAVHGPSYFRNITNKVAYGAASTTTVNFFAGGDTQAKTLTPNIRKTFSIGGYIYQDTTSVYNLINYNNSPSNNVTQFGGLADEYAPTDFEVSLGSTVTTFTGTMALHGYGAHGSWAVGGTSDPGANYRLKVTGQLGFTQALAATPGTDSIAYHNASTGKLSLGAPHLPIAAIDTTQATGVSFKYLPRSYVSTDANFTANSVNLVPSQSAVKSALQNIPASSLIYSGYSIPVNNNSGIATPTTAVYREVGEQNYTGTITWTGTTAPSGTSTAVYNWEQIGKRVTLYINLVYATAGTADTQVTLSLPSDCPTPYLPSNIPNAAGNVVSYQVGDMRGGVTLAGAITEHTVLEVNAAATGYQTHTFVSSAQAAKYVHQTITYTAQ